jgi:hypothetical protein
VPKVCPSRAHFSGLWRTSAVQAVATSSFQIQLGRGLLARSCLHLWAPVDLSRARFQAIVLDARTGKPPRCGGGAADPQGCRRDDLTAGSEGRSRGGAREGTYRIRVAHSRFLPEVAQKQRKGRSRSRAVTVRADGATAASRSSGTSGGGGASGRCSRGGRGVNVKGAAGAVPPRGAALDAAAPADSECSCE